MKISNNKTFKLNNSGFSLMEIMIVLVIIGGIMGLVVPRVIDGQRRAAVKNTQAKLGNIDSKVSEYQAECGKLPTSIEFIVADTADCPKWTGSSSLKNTLKDEWGTDFIYEANAKGYTVKSLGMDKKEGGIEYNKDIFSEGSSVNE